MTTTPSNQATGRHALPYGLVARLRDRTTRTDQPRRRRELRDQLVAQQPTSDQLVARLRTAGHL